MTEETKKLIELRRAELGDEKLAEGWDFTWRTTPDAIIGCYVTPDGEFVGDDEVLERHELSERW